jgi:hypothetical protein
LLDSAPEIFPLDAFLFEKTPCFFKERPKGQECRPNVESIQQMTQWLWLMSYLETNLQSPFLLQQMNKEFNSLSQFRAAFVHAADPNKALL